MPRKRILEAKYHKANVWAWTCPKCKCENYSYDVEPVDGVEDFCEECHKIITLRSPKNEEPGL